MGCQSIPGELKNGIALACEAGVTDAGYVNERADFIDLAFLGGIHADPETRRAALRMIDRGREEFIYSDVTRFLMEQMNKLGNGLPVGFNIRSSNIDPLLEIADLLESHGYWLELNAHCRQKEMIDIGCGHSLLRDDERLSNWVENLSDYDIPVGVKIREGVCNEGQVASLVEESGASFIHIDCMDRWSVISEVRNESDLFIIANNGVRSKRDVDEFIELGADMVSTARGGRTPEMLRDINEE